MNMQPLYNQRPFGYWLLFLLIALAMLSPVLAASAAADSPMPENKVPRQVEITTRRLTDDLEQQGYEVAPGYFKLYRERDCPYSYEVLRSCLGNNPAAPYVLPIVPPWPDEWVDPATHDMLGPTVEGYNASYRLDPREAIVIFGQLPPPARYFGLQTYLLSRPGDWEPGSDQYKFVSEHLHSLLNTFFTKLPKNDRRLELFADLSDPINNVVIENRSDKVWDQVRYFVITPDKNMDLAVRQALSQLGAADNDIFTQQIPSIFGDKKMAIGLDEGSDDFVTVLRYAMPDDGGKEGTPSNRWREGLPLDVLRIRDTRPAHPPQPYPWVDFEARSGTTPPETDLASDLITLAKAVCSRWGQPCNLEGEDFDKRVPQLLNMQPKPLLLTGPECVQVGMNCLAPNEDAAYFMSKKLPFPDDRVYALVGALGTETGNATYVGLGLNSSRTQLGFHNIDDDALAGTANAYAVPNHELFFLQYFARDCVRIKALTEGSPCSSVVDLLPRCYDLEDPNCEMLALSVRNYLIPNSQRGPAPELTLSPRIIPLQHGPEVPNRLWLPLILH